MANIPVGSGISSYAGVTVANQADTVTFADRYNFMTVTNTAASGNLYVTSNLSVPVDTSPETGSVEVQPGQTVELANGDIYWGQAYTVIPRGSIVVGNGAAYNASTNPSLPSQPGTVFPYGSSLAGGTADDGFVVGLISTAIVTYLITASG